MQAEHPQWQKGSRSSALRHGTQPSPCVCSESHPLDISQTISLHFAEASGISFKRLQHLLLRLQQYDCEIRYKPGKETLLADTLSRAYSEDYE